MRANIADRRQYRSSRLPSPAAPGEWPGADSPIIGGRGADRREISRLYASLQRRGSAGASPSQGRFCYWLLLLINDRDLTTIGESGAVDALGPDLAWQERFVCADEAHLLEKLRHVGQREDGRHADGVPFGYAGLHQHPPVAFALLLLRHGQ